ncbi:MAG TPA: GNAT family N-acetyltransferase [Ktedonobacterales bacterium]|nr:GNAT family N-acetyltransferase [Ktedonobacterales bacterium]
MQTNKPTEREITLRAAAVEDAPTILMITRAAFEEFRNRLDPPSGALDETLEDLRASAFQPDHGAVLAFVQGQPAGVLRWSTPPERGYLYVGRVAVLPAYRRQGIASALMRWIDAHAAAVGLPAVQFGVRLQSPENIRFYEHLGYHISEYAHHAGYDLPTFVWMRKDLQAPAWPLANQHHGSDAE